jgi:hypothetical protein
VRCGDRDLLCTAGSRLRERWMLRRHEVRNQRGHLLERRHVHRGSLRLAVRRTNGSVLREWPQVPKQWLLQRQYLFCGRHTVCGGQHLRWRNGVQTVRGQWAALLRKQYLPGGAWLLYARLSSVRRFKSTLLPDRSSLPRKQ